MAVPAVCSPLAASGVDAVAGAHLLVARDTREYGEAILKLLDDQPERRRLAAAGRRRMLSHHNWDASLARFDRLIDECLSRYQGSAGRGDRRGGR